MFDSLKLKQDFPILQTKVHGQPLVYLDNAATSQKPRAVVDAVSNYYQTSNANVHRGVHALSDASTTAWETARQTIAAFFGASPDELIITRNTTEALNGVAYGWADHNLQAGDVIITTAMEHHSSIVTWQLAAKRAGAKLEVIKVTDQGRLDLDHLQKLCQQHGVKIKLVALAHVSNTLGVKNPVGQIRDILNQSAAKAAKICLDSAQAAPHIKVNFAKLGADFLAFSGHKMLGPMGVGGLLVKKSLLTSGEMQPWLFGGGMIDSVELQQTTFHLDLSERFVAGTPDVASAVGLAAACDYLTKLGMEEVEQHDRDLVKYALEKLSAVPEVELIGPVEPAASAALAAASTNPAAPIAPPVPSTPSTTLDRLGSVAFIYQGVHAHDVAQILDSQGIAVRSGHHCTMPLHQQFNWQATVRASFQVYNSPADIDKLVKGLEKVKKVFLK